MLITILTLNDYYLFSFGGVRLESVFSLKMKGFSRSGWLSCVRDFDL